MNETHSSISRRWKRKHYWLKSKLRSREGKRRGVPGKKLRGVRERVCMQVASSQKNQKMKSSTAHAPKLSYLQGFKMNACCLSPHLKTEECAYRRVSWEGPGLLGSEIVPFWSVLEALCLELRGMEIGPLLRELGTAHPQKAPHSSRGNVLTHQKARHSTYRLHYT